MALKEFKIFYNIQKTHLNFYCIEGIGSKKSAGPGVLRCTCTCTQKMFVGFVQCRGRSVFVVSAGLLTA